MAQEIVYALWRGENVAIAAADRASGDYMLDLVAVLTGYPIVDGEMRSPFGGHARVVVPVSHSTPHPGGALERTSDHLTPPDTTDVGR